VCAAARRSGIHLVHHAGEFACSESIRETVEVGRDERIGHGVRALDDPDLVAILVDRRLALEVCPSSNVTLGVASGLSTHPLPHLIEAGLITTLNTDIPAIVGTTLAQEYQHVRDAFGYDDQTLAVMANAAIEASFAPEDIKAGLVDAVRAWPAQPSH
jgi:adenosine deaminase